MAETHKSGFGTAGLVLGIVGICTSFIPIINNLSFVMGILAIVFSIIALAKKAGKAKIIITIILGVLAIALTISSQKALSDSVNNAIDTFNNDMGEITGDKTEEILKNNVEVVLGNFKVTKDGYFTETVLKATVKNKTTENKSFNIQVEAVDTNGARIANDYIYANSLNAGQSQEFKLFEYVEDDKLNAMKSATFKIVEASMY